MDKPHAPDRAARTPGPSYSPQGSGIHRGAVAAAAVLIALAIGGGWYWWQQQRPTPLDARLGERSDELTHDRGSRIDAGRGRREGGDCTADAVAAEHGITAPFDDTSPVIADHAEGVERGVIGSPHFFTGGDGSFCPSLAVSRDAEGALHVEVDTAAFETFVATCFT